VTRVVVIAVVVGLVALAVLGAAAEMIRGRRPVLLGRPALVGV
jgi:hypothetical protein